MLIVSDVFEYRDFPIFVDGNKEKCQEQYNTYDYGDMQKVPEVFELNAQKEPQIEAHRAFPKWLKKKRQDI